MNITKKQIVLQQLAQEVEPISLPDLLIKLGPDFAERTLRRWLSQLVEQGIVQKFGSKKTTKYLSQKQIETAPISKHNTFSTKSLNVIQKMRRPIYERMPVAYSHEWIDSYRPNITYYIPEDERNKLHIAGRRLRQEDPAGTYAHQIFNRLLIDLSYNSSRLEGNTYSLIDTQRLILEGKTAEGKLLEENVMILNHKEAIRFLVDTAPKLEVTKQTIFTLHYLLSEGLLEPHLSGKIRDHAVRIGGSTYLPFEDPNQLQLQLDVVIKKAALIKDPYEQSIFLLIHISYLQAFSDVNKRVARLCANIPLIKNNLVPLSFNDVERDDYNSSLIAIYELQNVNPLIDLFIFSYMRTCAMYDSTVKTLGFDEVRVRYRQQRRSLIREIITKKIKGKVLDDFVSTQCKGIVEKKYQKEFYDDVMEDLREIDESRIVGLGVTSEDLHAWLNYHSG